MARPQPRRVWMVRPARPETVEGTLTLSGETLVFEPLGGHELAVPLNRIRTVRRRPGSPVLVVRYTDAEGRDAKAFFFFAPPPPLSSEEEIRARRRPFLPSSRGLERTASIMSLRQAAKQARASIKEWVAAIRRGAAG